ncbi:MAG: helix-turn-helix transcriptional regulator [Chloroflexota bacterium]
MVSEPFSPREKQVADLLLQGRSNKQIAATLGVSNRTVEFHLSNIYLKLGVASRTEAVLKLSESSLRESTGDPRAAGLRESAVEKIGESADNGGKPVSLRRQPMRVLIRLLITLIAAAALIVLAIGIAAVFRTRGENIPGGEGYQVLGPATIEVDGMLFEASGDLTCTEFTFNLNGTFPEGFSDQFPNGEIPPMFTDVAFAASVNGTPLELEPIGGGGGGGGMGAFDTLGQGRAYRLLTPLSAGQEAHITTYLTFNDYVGIPEPVPFELYLFVGSCATPTLQAYQYHAADTITTPAGVTIVVSARLTRAELSIHVEASGPMALVADQVGVRDLFVYRDLQVEFPDPARVVSLQEAGGGGGGPGDGETFLLSQGKGYTVLSALEVGQVIPVTIWITFDPFAGIPDPVPFEFELVVVGP